MTQAHWIQNARYRVIPIDVDGDSLRGVYASNKDEVVEALIESGTPLAIYINLKTGQTGQVESVLGKIKWTTVLRGKS